MDRAALKLSRLTAEWQYRALRNAVESALDDILKLRNNISAMTETSEGPAPAASQSQILEIRELTLVLEGGSLKDEMCTCHSKLSAVANWRVVNAADARRPEDRYSSCSIPVSKETLKQWFANGARRRADVTALPESVGRQIARNMLFDISERCDYGQEPLHL